MKFAIFTIKYHDSWKELWEKVKGNPTLKYFNLKVSGEEKKPIEISGETGDFLRINKKPVRGFFFKQEITGKAFKIAVINQFGESGDERKEDNTTGMKMVIDNYSEKNDEIFIGEHKSGGSISHEDQSLKSFHIGSFQHGVKGDRIYGAIEAFVEKLDFESFEKLCEAIQKKTLIPDFAFIRYRICHLWLPLYLDLQQIIKTTDIKQRRDYARQIIEEYRENQDKENHNHPFLQLLADFNFLVTGEEETADIKTSLNSDTLPGGKSVKDIFKEAELEYEELEQFIKHAPLKKFLESLDRANTPDKLLDIIDKDVNGFDAREFNDQVSQLDKNLTELESKLKEKLGGTL